MMMMMKIILDSQNRDMKAVPPRDARALMKMEWELNS